MTRKKWYMVIGLAVVIAVGMTAVSIQSARKSEKEQQLIFQLKQLRSAVQIYAKIRGNKPPDLSTAMEAKYKFGQPIQWKMERDAKGNPIDPFGNRYRYGPTGWVQSSTPGYETW